MAVDTLRSCYTVNCKLDHDSDRVWKLTWFWCAPDAKRLPFPCSVNSPTWAPTRPRGKWIGIAPNAKKTWSNGKTPPGKLGKCWRGDKRLFVEGQSVADPVPPYSECCPFFPPIEKESPKGLGGLGATFIPALVIEGELMGLGGLAAPFADFPFDLGIDGRASFLPGGGFPPYPPPPIVPVSMGSAGGLGATVIPTVVIEGSLMGLGSPGSSPAPPVLAGGLLGLGSPGLSDTSPPVLAGGLLGLGSPGWAPALYMGCTSCSSGTAFEWGFTVAGATGSGTPLNGDWVLGSPSGCTWAQTTSPGGLLGGLTFSGSTAILQLQDGTGNTAIYVGTVNCTAAFNVTRIVYAGAGTVPLTITLTPL